MVTINKPRGITVTVRDREDNKSKTITIYGTTLEEVHKKIEKSLKD